MKKARFGKGVVWPEATEEERIYKGMVGYLYAEEEEEGIHHGL